ncbi:hypothetical protein [Bosea sp. (in: a-proteobacteria)]|uniref:hypothetical protein n=1 Tax=Bosea sp. (in: a-proteobacteria) TaxID=1871050 RepID=UPI003B3A3B43
MFDSCGCDHCPHSDCWDIPEDDFDDEIGDFDFDFDFPRCCPAPARLPFICEELPPPCVS